jgi:hypothetical protein
MKAQTLTPHLLCLSLTQTSKTVAIPTSTEAEEGVSIQNEAEEVADLVISTLSHRTNTHRTSSHKVHKDHNLHSMVRILTPSTSQNTIGQPVKFVERLVTML